MDNKVDSMKIGRKSETKTIRCADIVRNNHKKQADDIIYYPLMFSRRLNSQLFTWDERYTSQKVTSLYLIPPLFYELLRHSCFSRFPCICLVSESDKIVSVKDFLPQTPGKHNRSLL